MPDFGIFRGFNEKLFGNKLYAGQLPTQLGLIGSVSFGFDTDAQAFFDRVTTAGGTLSATEKLAIDTLVKKMKLDGIWAKMKAIYPMVGASSAACSQNLKSSSFTGAFTSGWTFASTGVTGNGTSAYMNTSILPNTIMNFNSQSYFIYKTSVQSTTVCEFGVGNPSDGVQAFLYNGWNTINENFSSNSFTSRTIAGAYILNRNNSNDKKLFINGTLFQTRTSAATNLTLNEVWLGCRNNGGFGQFFTNTETRFFSIGDGLTDTEAANLYTAVQAFQTTLNRQVS